jgi:hypothetical protein
MPDHRYGLVDARTGEPIVGGDGGSTIGRTITVQSMDDRETNANEDLYGGYDFFGTGDVQQAMESRKKALRRVRTQVGEFGIPFIVRSNDDGCAE